MLECVYIWVPDEQLEDWEGGTVGCRTIDLPTGKVGGALVDRLKKVLGECREWVEFREDGSSER